MMSRDIPVGIETRYGLDGPGIKSRWRRDFPHPSRPAPGATQPPTQRIPGLYPGVKRPGRGVDHPPPSTAVVKERVELHLYTPYGPSWAVLGWTLSLCIMDSCVSWVYITCYLRTDTETSTISRFTLPNNNWICSVIKSQHVAGVLSHHLSYKGLLQQRLYTQTRCTILKRTEVIDCKTSVKTVLQIRLKWLDARVLLPRILLKKRRHNRT